MQRASLRARLFLGLFVLALPTLAIAQGTRLRPQDQDTDSEPKTWPVARVVDGDTIHVQRNGRIEKLRLLCVDTEEPTTFQGGDKPRTRFGDLASQHLKDLLRCDERGNPLDPKAPVRVRLEFEGEREERGNFGRLLCYVHYGDLHLNLMLVEEGWSPYFSKYGFSRRHHEAFAAAQAKAREQRLGLWDPKTDPEGKRRDYVTMLKWWDARGEAIRTFEKHRAAGAQIRDARTDAPALRNLRDQTETIFGAALSITIERPGAKVLLEGPRDHPVEIFLPPHLLTPDLLTHLATHALEGHSNFLYARGTIRPTRRTLQIHISAPTDLGWNAPPKD